MTTTNSCNNQNFSSFYSEQEKDFSNSTSSQTNRQFSFQQEETDNNFLVQASSNGEGLEIQASPSHSKGVLKNSQFATYDRGLIDAALEKNLEKIKQIFLLSKNFTLTPFIYALYIQALIAADQGKEAINAFEEMKLQGIQPNLAICSAVLHEFRRQGKSDEEALLLREMKKNDFSSEKQLSNPVLFLFNKAISYAADDKNAQKAQDIFQQIISRGLEPDIYSYTSLMRAFWETKQFSKVNETFDQMQEKIDIKTTVVAYNILLKSLIKQKKRDEALALLLQMQKKGILPDNKTEKLSSKLEKMRESEKTHATAHKLERNDPAPVRYAKAISHGYTNAISYAGQHNDVKKAQDLFNQFINRGLQPNICLYNSLMEAYFNAKLFSEVQEIFNQMLGQNIEPDVVAYNILLKSLLQQHKSNKALRLWQRMQHKNIQPDQATLESLFILSLIEPERMEKMHSNMSSGMSAAPIQWYNYAIFYVARDKDAEKARDIFKKIVINGLKPNIYSYVSLMQAFYETQQFSEVKKNFDQMLGQNIEPNVVAYNILLLSFIQQEDKLEEALATWQQMQDKRIQSDEVTVNILTDFYVMLKKKHPGKAQYIFNQIMNELNTGNYKSSTCMRVFLLNKQYLQVSSTFDRMINPNDAAYNILLQSFAQQDKLQDVLIVWEKMKLKGIHPSDATLEELAALNLRQKNLQAAETLFEKDHYKSHLGMRDHLECLDCDGFPFARACVLVSKYLKAKLKSQNEITPFIIVTIGHRSDSDKVFTMRIKMQDFIQEFYPQIDCHAHSENLGALICKMKNERVSKKVLSNRLFIVYDRKLTDAALEKNPEKIKQIYQELSKKDFTSTSFIYASIIEALIAADQGEEAKNAFVEMKLKGIKPNQAIYSVFLHEFRRQGKSVEEALLLQEMKKNGFSSKKPVSNPVLVLCNKAISYAADDKDAQKAQDIFEHIISLGLEPNIYCYTSLMQAFWETEQFSKVKETFELMQKQDNIKLNVLPYNILLKSLIKQKNRDEAFALLLEMQDKRIWNEVTDKLSIKLEKMERV